MSPYLPRFSNWQDSPSFAPSRTRADGARSDIAPLPANGNSRESHAPRKIEPDHPAGYGNKRLSGKALLATVLVHIAGIFILLGLGVSGQREEAEKRIAVFDVRTQTPPPPAPPPPEPSRMIAPETPATAQITAPQAVITLTNQQSAAPVRIEPQPVSVQVEAPPAPAKPAAPPAPVTPPDFSAGQLNNPGPEYPFQSRRDREQGVALLKVLVTPEGRAGEVRLERSSGYSRLDRAAMKVVRHWRFLPAKQAGVPVAAWVLVPIGFSLS